MKLLYAITGLSNLESTQFDGIIVVAERLDVSDGALQFLKAPLKLLKELDCSAEESVNVVPLPGPFKRLIFSGTGPLNRDFDDIRSFSDAAWAGTKKALQAGCKSPLLITLGNNRFPQAKFVSALGALAALYVPLEIREDCPERQVKASVFGFLLNENTDAARNRIEAYESARTLVRDIQGSDPERMAPPRVADYVEEHFKGTSVNVQIISDTDTIESSYPCLGAVNRCAKLIPRHRARVIKLSYEGSGPITETIFLVGKGVTYDTGGADIKAGGVMVGMHRDKGGASAVAGFFEALDKLKPSHLKVYGTMSMVRNSVGANCYVSDEIVTARSGVRVRIGNTDAEGRMAMVDCLCESKEIAMNEVNPQLYTIATLTGHAIIAMGTGYSIAMDNGPALRQNNANLLRQSGEQVGDMFEVSTIRRDDYRFHKGKSEYEDVLQSNNQPSSRTPRGHQSPSAFLIMTSGLDKHGIDSDSQLKYTHLDIAGSEGDFPGIPTGSPVPALINHHIRM